MRGAEVSGGLGTDAVIGGRTFGRGRASDEDGWALQTLCGISSGMRCASRESLNKRPSAELVISMNAISAAQPGHRWLA